MQNRGGGPKKVAIGATQESDKKRICTSPQPSSIQARQRGRATQRPKRQNQRPGRKGSREGKKWQRQEGKLLATTSSRNTLENDMLVQLEKLRGRAEEETKPYKREQQQGASWSPTTSALRTTMQQDTSSRTPTHPFEAQYECMMRSKEKKIASLFLVVWFTFQFGQSGVHVWCFGDVLRVVF
jgi:hypothetical protein